MPGLVKEKVSSRFLQSPREPPLHEWSGRSLLSVIRGARGKGPRDPRGVGLSAFENDCYGKPVGIDALSCLPQHPSPQHPGPSGRDWSCSADSANRGTDNV